MKTTMYLAGGCFWCVEADFSKSDSSLQLMPGYMGGNEENPSYQQVCIGLTGHYEVVRVTFDEKHFESIIDTYWRMIDPFDPGGQLHDRGLQYRTVIFFTTPQQERYAIKRKNQIQKASGRMVYTLILPAKTFYPAEVYHQRYFVKNKSRYNQYVKSSLRQERLDAVWAHVSNRD